MRHFLKPIIAALLFLVILSNPLYSKEYDISNSSISAGIDIISNLKVEAENYQAGEYSNYTISFEVDKNAHSDLKNGKLIFTFPVGFDLSNSEAIEYIDDSDEINYILKSEVSGDNISVHLRESKRKQSMNGEDILLDSAFIISVTIDSVLNISQTGNYQISLVAVKKNNTVLFGPALSQQFSIIAGKLVSIFVNPSNNMTLKAGESIQFSAIALDKFGNQIDDLEFEWSLVECTQCPGFFEESTLFITTVGQAYTQAVYEEITGLSGLITAIPGDLDKMVLEIDPTQAVGHKLRGSASIILYDAFDNLKTDYDLSNNPITLNIEDGTLQPEIINDPALFNNGIIDILMTDITYLGNSATTEIYADNGLILSNSTTVSFNRYDILDALDANGNTINKIFTNQQTIIFVLAINNGNTTISDYIHMFAFFKSQNDTTSGSYEYTSIGVADTLGILLPIHPGGVDEDTLVIILQSTFIDDKIVYDTAFFPIEILEPATLNLVEGSFKPDNILVDLPFDISFEVATNADMMRIDSVSIEIIAQFPNSQNLTIFSGSPQYSSQANGIIKYENLEAVLSPGFTSENPIMEIPLVINYNLYSSDNLFTLENNKTESLIVYFDKGLSLIENSLIPTIVTAGTGVSFDFQIENIFDFPIEFISQYSGFRLYNNSFSTTTNLIVSDNQLSPGTNTISTSDIFIPNELVGEELEAEFFVNYLLQGISDTISYGTKFDPTSLPIQVVESGAIPEIQILSLELVAPNSPKVNVGQTFQVKATITNLSEILIDTLKVQLVSDGPFDFISNQEILDFEALSTVEIIFEVTALDINNIADHFQLEILNDDITQASPLDNIAIVMVETPADVVLSYNLFGVVNNMVDYNHHIDIDIALENFGMAETSVAEYQIIITGHDLDGADTIVDNFEVNSHFDFEFMTPTFDTTIIISFVLTELPIDLNINQPAMSSDTSFELVFSVVSSKADLTVESNIIGSNLILPMRPKELFELTLSNTGFSSVGTFIIEKISLQLLDTYNNPLNARENINISNTGFYENDLKISTVAAGGNMITFYFDNFILNPGETRTIQFIAEFKNIHESSVILKIVQDGIIATFLDGPNAGLPVSINSPSGSNIISHQLVLKNSTLDGSFIISNNPFNPNNSQVELSYELTENAPIEFRVFTLTGQEVYALDIFMGEPGSFEGENFISWDGRNNSGEIVLNGIYIALIKNISNGEDARIKIAVLK